MKKEEIPKILEKITNSVKKIAEELKLEILEVGYVKEAGIKILRVIADSKEGLNVDESTVLNERISEELDKLDLIDEEYYLEVSSPGLEKELKTEEDIKNAIGQYVNTSFYEKLDGKKEIEGYLEEYENNIFRLRINVKGREKNINIEKEKVSKIRLAIKF